MAVNYSYCLVINRIESSYLFIYLLFIIVIIVSIYATTQIYDEKVLYTQFMEGLDNNLSLYSKDDPYGGPDSWPESQFREN